MGDVAIEAGTDHDAEQLLTVAAQVDRTGLPSGDLARQQRGVGGKAELPCKQVFVAQGEHGQRHAQSVVDRAIQGAVAPGGHDEATDSAANPGCRQISSSSSSCQTGCGRSPLTERA